MSFPECNGNADTLAERNRQLLATGAYSDFVIKCGNGEFKEGITKQALLKETGTDVFEKTLEFLYTGTYDDNSAGISDALTQRVDTHFVHHAKGSSTAMVPRDLGSASDSFSRVTADQDLEDCLQKGKIWKSSALLLNVQIYNLAEFLQVPNLKKESLKRCKQLMSEHFDAASFVDGIKEALTLVNEQDPALRAQILRSCAGNWQQVASCPALEDVLMAYEPIAWIVLKEKVAEYEKDHDEQTQNICRLTEQVERLQAEFSVVKDELAQAYKLVLDHNNCRNCGQDFGAYLEKLYDRKPILRCNKCRCRHETLS